MFKNHVQNKHVLGLIFFDSLIVLVADLQTIHRKNSLPGRCRAGVPAPCGSKHKIIADKSERPDTLFGACIHLVPLSR